MRINIKSKCAPARSKLIATTLGVQAVVLGTAWYAAYAWSSAAAAPGEIGYRLALSATLGGALALALTSLALGLIIRLYEASMTRTTRRLESELGEKLERELTTQHALIFGLARLADHRDRDTGKHIDRICAYSRLLASNLGQKYTQIDEPWIARLELAASLHDIGKVGIPDEILLKPGSLTPEERTVMEQHARIGGETLRAIRDRLGSDPLIDMSIEVAEQHHERWDGRGYPEGLDTRDIALSARIVALADVYDALTSKRVYKDAAAHDEVVAIIQGSRGSHFDPEVVDAFLEVSARFNAVREQLHAPIAAAGLGLAA